MDHQRFDNVTRRLASSFDRRSGLRAALGAALGSLAAAKVSAGSAETQRCPRSRRCGRKCCKQGFDCILGRCQREQRVCTPVLEPCSEDGECCSGWCRPNPVPVCCVSYGRCYDPNVCCRHHRCNPYQYCEFCGQDALCSSGGDCCDPAFPVCSGGRCAAQ